MTKLRSSIQLKSDYQMPKIQINPKPDACSPVLNHVIGWTLFEYQIQGSGLLIIFFLDFKRLLKNGTTVSSIQMKKCLKSKQIVLYSDNCLNI